METSFSEYCVVLAERMVPSLGDMFSILGRQTHMCELSGLLSFAKEKTWVCRYGPDDLQVKGQKRPTNAEQERENTASDWE
ncbi:hypothetical protein RvY_07408 [Ramazzottius varieornatus]|uniref:Uncharacterized protein n=1 Tax=Ramazzottius varieornatus TaxID=947166 RepID=A0A1D1VBI8_RAMVA|nr:hypothetical protein RvY_07408 [Ramazzottius varieornatus]